MNDLLKLVNKNPAISIGIALAAGWAFGSGQLQGLVSGFLPKPQPTPAQQAAAAKAAAAAANPDAGTNF